MDQNIKSTNSKRPIPIGFALLPLILMMAAMILTIVVFKGDPHPPLIFGAVVAGIVAWKFGYSWKEIETSIYDGIRLVLPAVIIIMIVGMIIGTWIGGGIVATMIFYGIKIISPSFYLVTICILCLIVSTSIGSSWTTIGTIGIAGMGIAYTMGIPAEMAAGAIISGAYFGDKMSPLSDTTNLASGIANAGLFDHIHHMLYTTIPATFIALTAYWILGLNLNITTADTGNLQSILVSMQEEFVISPLLLLVPVIVILLVVKKVPPIPVLIIATLLGAVCHIFVQGGSMTDAISTLQSGYFQESNNELLNELFNRGGIDSMMYTVSLAVVAMTFAGIMEKTGILKSIVEQILKLARTPGKLVGSTVLSSFAVNMIAADNYISIIVPARMYAKTYKDYRLHPKNLSRAVEDGGTVTSVFIPWSTCGIFIFATLGVHPFSYAPYAIMNLAVPIIALVYASLGLFIAKNEDAEEEEEVQTVSM